MPPRRRNRVNNEADLAFTAAVAQAMINTRTDAELAAAVQNALQTLLPQIRAEIREEFRTEFKELFFLQFFPRAEQERLNREYHSIRLTDT
nr:hypothetical protein [Tanacetum cinerariifolium]